jgi:hypothetical protein
MSALTDPPFAANPPVKINVNAKTLGLVLLVLGAIGILLSALGLITIFGFCGTYAYLGGCGLPIIWLLGELVGLAGLVIGTIGAYRMYQGNAQGKEWVIYGLVLGFVGAIIGLIGNLSAYSGVLGYGAGGAIFGLIIDAIIYFIVYYVVIVSRFPGQVPLAPPGATPWGSGPSAPPPPPV